MIKDILEVFFPTTCLGCRTILKKTEKHICFECHHHLAETLHFRIDQNELIQKFYGRLPLEFASSKYFFRKDSPVQVLIHELKYRNKQFLGEFFAHQMIEQLKEKNKIHQFDLIVPVPLHIRKLKKRGYNQLDLFGRCLAKELQIAYVPDLLIKTTHTLTQTKKTLMNRNKYDQNLFKLNTKYDTTHKHILLIDDVITTGITLEECGKVLVQNQNTKLSLATIAYTV